MECMIILINLFRTEFAEKAFQALFNRFFAGKVITVRFFNHQLFLEDKLNSFLFN